MIDNQELRRELRLMKPRTKIYELVKAEMKQRGRWKNLPRGKQFMEGEDKRRKALEGEMRSE